MFAMRSATAPGNGFAEGFSNGTPTLIDPDNG
jgi:hypothetical protein